MSSPIHDEETEAQRGIQLAKAMQVFWGRSGSPPALGCCALTEGCKFSHRQSPQGAFLHEELLSQPVDYFCPNQQIGISWAL